MNKKQELVEKVLEKLEKSECVIEEGSALRASVSFWDKYPDGHYADMMDDSVEHLLSRLTEANLGQIANSPIPSKTEFYVLWREWGKQGFLKSKPELMDVGGIPTLRIRHDSYLSWFRGYCFQNSYDAYGNGSNGESRKNLQDVMNICKDLLERSPEWTTCCHTLLLSAPFSACRGKRSFHAALQECPEAFDALMEQTNKRLMHIQLPEGMTLDKLSATMRKETAAATVFYEFPITRAGKLFALLCISRRSVQLIWMLDRVRSSFTVNFPVWDDEMSLDENAYYNQMWEGLAVTMLTLAGFMVTEYQITPLEPARTNASSALFHKPDAAIDSLSALSKKLNSIQES